MAVKVVQKLTELLNEEKWTRATLNNYTIKNFTDLDAIILDAAKHGKLADIRNLTTEHLNHTPNSIIALYVPLAFLGKALFGITGIFAAYMLANIASGVLGYVWAKRKAHRLAVAEVHPDATAGQESEKSKPQAVVAERLRNEP